MPEATRPAGGPSLPQARRIVTEIPGPRSRELLARQRRLVPAGVGATLPVFVKAAGGVIVDADGNSFIDFGSGIAATTVGNSAPRVVRRAAAQLDRFTHTCFLVNPYASYLDVCEKLTKLAPVPDERRTFLVNTGAEAVENAVKIARAATGRPAVVAFDHAYHGRTLLTMTLTSKNRPYKQGFGPFAPEVYRAPMAYPYRWRSGPERCAEEAAEALIDLLDRQIGAENVAAALVEPIQGEGGFIVPAPGFLARVATICRVRGILLIADEVQTGIARTGRMFACEHEGIEPDLLATAKGLGGGLPLGAVTGRAELMDAVPAGGLGGTYSGNPVACEAALGVFEEIREHDLLRRAREIGDLMLARLGKLQTAHSAIGDVRGRGAMTAVELIATDRGRDDEPRREAVAEDQREAAVGVVADRMPDPWLATRIAKRCHTAGLLVLTAGSHGNVLRFLPPLSIPNALPHECLDILADAIAEETGATARGRGPGTASADPLPTNASASVRRPRPHGQRQQKLGADMRGVQVGAEHRLDPVHPAAQGVAVHADRRRGRLPLAVVLQEHAQRGEQFRAVRTVVVAQRGQFGRRDLLENRTARQGRHEHLSRQRLEPDQLVPTARLCDGGGVDRLAQGDRAVRGLVDGAEAGPATRPAATRDAVRDGLGRRRRVARQQHRRAAGADRAEHRQPALGQLMADDLQRPLRRATGQEKDTHPAPDREAGIGEVGAGDLCGDDSVQQHAQEQSVHAVLLVAQAHRLLRLQRDQRRRVTEQQMVDGSQRPLAGQHEPAVGTGPTRTRCTASTPRGPEPAADATWSRAAVRRADPVRAARHRADAPRAPRPPRPAGALRSPSRRRVPGRRPVRHRAARRASSGAGSATPGPRLRTRARPGAASPPS